MSSQKNWEEPELFSNSSRAMAMVPKALKGSTGCSRYLRYHRGARKPPRAG